jgi:hypothetical protein
MQILHPARRIQDDSAFGVAKIAGYGEASRILGYSSVTIW